MAHLRISITVKIPLPKTAGSAVAETIKAHAAAQDAARALISSGMYYPDEVKVEQWADDSEPAPKPERRKRQPRAALGSSPLANNPDPHANSGARPALQASGEPGDLDVPGFLQRSAS